MRNRVTDLGDIDPARVDVAAAPKPKPRKRKASPMPEFLGPETERAKDRMLKRPASPGIMFEPVGKGEAIGYLATSPHDNLAAWEIQIHDAFGTRSQSTVRTFIRHLEDLCGKAWNDADQQWKPSETELNMALNFISGTRPRNEMEAALAAQMLAVHLMQMKVSAQALGSGWVDPRDAAIAGKLARTYTMQVDVFARLRGRKSPTQSIKVRKETHVHYHDHRGAGETGQQPHEQRPALPSQEPGGQVVPLPRRSGKAGV